MWMLFSYTGIWCSMLYQSCKFIKVNLFSPIPSSSYSQGKYLVVCFSASLLTFLVLIIYENSRGNQIIACMGSDYFSSKEQWDFSSCIGADHFNYPLRLVKTSISFKHDFSHPEDVFFPPQWLYRETRMNSSNTGIRNMKEKVPSE